MFNKKGLQIRLSITQMAKKDSDCIFSHQRLVKERKKHLFGARQLPEGQIAQSDAELNDKERTAEVLFE